MRKSKEYTSEDHTFVVCAYGESPYLEDCIQSLLQQTRRSAILIATSTENHLIRYCAEKYRIPLFINTGETGIAGDWNFAVSCTNTALVTIAHQDDLYEKEYTETMLQCVNHHKTPLLFFSAYYELTNDRKESNSRLIRFKKLLVLPIYFFPACRFARRMSLAFGNPICCPSVTYLSNIIKTNSFIGGMKSNLDWDEWERLSKLKGTFVYSKKPLMCHRIHAESESSKIIGENKRAAEDYQMFLRPSGRTGFWSEPGIKRVTTR